MSTQGHRSPAIGDAAGPAAEGTMRAVVQDAYGSADVLHLANIARPEFGNKEVPCGCTRQVSTVAPGT